MAFSNPLLLFGLFAILVPIVIHLFNFRRYKTIYFSNVKMLEDIKKKTKREQTIQQLVVLALRILGIAALVLAFAQPLTGVIRIFELAHAAETGPVFDALNLCSNQQ